VRASSALVRLFEDSGFTLIRWNGPHLIWRCPCGKNQVTSCKTPGKGRSVANANGDIARALRACEKKQRSAA
jgi:hypothetical protein